MAITEKMLTLLEDTDASTVEARMLALLEAEDREVWKPGTAFSKGMALPKGWRMVFGTPRKGSGSVSSQVLAAKFGKGAKASGGGSGGDAKSAEDRAKEARKREDSIQASLEQLQVAQYNGKFPRDKTPEQHLKIAEEFNAKHAAGLGEFQKALESVSPKDAKVKSRIKDVGSALGKLSRKPPEFDSEGNFKERGYRDATDLGDGTGGRIIVKSIDEVKDVVAKIERTMKVKYRDNYVDSPNGGDSAFGYRSFHLTVEDQDGLLKEIQVRTANQNTHADWAHKVYKPETRELQEVLDKHGDEIRRYARDAGDYFYSMDRGKGGSAKKPPCPPVLKTSFGCL